MSDTVNDFYDPPSNPSEFEQLYFSEIEEDDLFWLNNINNDFNSPHKKINERSGVNMRTGVTAAFTNYDKVYQKN